MYKFNNLVSRHFLSKFHLKAKCLHTVSENVFKVKEEVTESLLSNKPVVALESALITHGLPYPDNLRCAIRLEEIVRQYNAVPATIGVLNGIIHIGMDSKKIEMLSSSKSAIKVSRRDFPYVLSKRIDGGTTVAGTLILAHKAGISVFATGGIGGVHRGAETSMDISADLYELSRTPMTVVSAGVKSILDINLTLEYLETLGVCVTTFGSSKTFPSFYTEHSQSPSPCNVANATEAAQLIYSRDILQLGSGILVAVPIPEKYKEDGLKAHSVIEKALDLAKKKQITGKSITPFVLDQVRLLSDGASLRANIGLLENNVEVGSKIAVELSKLKVRGGPSSSRTMLCPVKHELSSVISRPRPVVIGASILDIHVKVLEDIKMDGRTVEGKVQSTAGGVGRNVADCMTRLGANPFFISAVGAQEYADFLLNKMSHVDVKGIKIMENARTATCIVVLDSKGESVFCIGDMGINSRITPDQVEAHEDIIATAAMVITDSNVPHSTLDTIMNVCSNHKVPVWFEPTDISVAAKPFESAAWMTAISYASPNLNELRVIHEKVFEKTSPPLTDLCLNSKIEESLNLGIPLLKESLHTLVVTLASDGILLITTLNPDCPYPTRTVPTTTGKVRAVHYPAQIADSIISVSGAGDCFAAGMIASILRGSDPESCVRAGQRAAVLSLGSHHAVPDTISTDTVFNKFSDHKRNPISIPS